MTAGSVGSNQAFWRHTPIYLQVICIALLAFTARLALALYLPHQVLWPDGARYLRVAGNIVHHHGFGTLAENSDSVPTQPLFLAALEYCFGHSFVAFRIGTAILGAAACAFGCLFTLRLTKDPLVAWIAGVSLALYPNLVYLSALFEYPQALFILLISAFFYLEFEFTRLGRVGLLVAAGFLLGLAALTVPTVILLIPFMAAATWAASKRRAITNALIVVLCCSLPIGVWALRNEMAYHRFILVNETGGFNFWTANNDTYYLSGKEAVTPPCNPGHRDTTFCVEFREIYDGLAQARLPEDEIIVREDHAQWALGFRFWRNSPGRAVVLLMSKFFRFLDPQPDALHVGGGYGGTLARQLSAITYSLALLFGIAGLVVSWRSWRSLLPIYSFIGVLTAAYSVFLPATRYRLPIDFFLVIFAAVAARKMIAMISATREGHAIAPVEPAV